MYRLYQVKCFIAKVIEKKYSLLNFFFLQGMSRMSFYIEMFFFFFFLGKHTLKCKKEKEKERYYIKDCQKFLDWVCYQCMSYKNTILLLFFFFPFLVWPNPYYKSVKSNFHAPFTIIKQLAVGQMEIAL